jgi:hypothetical protein
MIVTPIDVMRLRRSHLRPNKRSTRDDRTRHRSPNRAARSSTAVTRAITAVVNSILIFSTGLLPRGGTVYQVLNASPNVILCDAYKSSALLPFHSVSFSSWHGSWGVRCPWLLLPSKNGPGPRFAFIAAATIENLLAGRSHCRTRSNGAFCISHRPVNKLSKCRATCLGIVRCPCGEPTH